MKKINLYVDEDIWRDFRVGCIQHGVSASKTIEVYLRQQVEEWSNNNRLQTSKDGRRNEE